MHRFAVISTALSLFALGCGSALPSAPTTPGVGPGFEPVEQNAPAGIDEANDPATALTLTPGDVITLQSISATTSETVGLVVDERGVLHVPLAGDVTVTDLDLTTAESRIEAAMRPFDATVRVTILLTNANGRRATVLGAVASPGRYDIIAGMRLADLLAVAGGSATTENDGFIISVANLHQAALVRDGAVVPVSLALAVTGDQRHNIRIRPGDHLYVPPELETQVSVLGEVNAATVLPYRPGLRLTRALAFAGGPTRDADTADIVIVRGPAAEPQVYAARLDELLAGEGFDPELAPGDIIYVGSSGLSNFRDVMTAIAPIIGIAVTTALGVAVIQSN